MFPRTVRWWSLALGAVLVAGCCYPVGEKVDGMVCDLAAKPRDLQEYALAVKKIEHYWLHVARRPR